MILKFLFLCFLVTVISSFAPLMSQEDFVNFYRAHLNLSEEDQKKFEDSITQPLPSAFRITQTEFATKIKERIEQYSFVQKVAYLPETYLFMLKSKEPEYKQFMEFLVAQTDAGHVQRQEVVSFLPHLFMQLKSSHTVLETCASPGSKTKNLLEIVKTGLLVSNDKTSSRVNILVSEAMKKAAPNLVITQMDAMHIPNTSIKFDRICCDVPCSSDGTCRKNPAILPKWKVTDAIALSNVQYRILTRALELLKEGGILVYSTCSFNPIENEYVINKALAGSNEYELLNSFEHIQYEGEDERKVKVRKGISKFKYNEFEYENEELEKCFRLLPHDQNTGGFFIAVIHKKVTKKEENSQETINISSNNSSSNNKETKLNSTFVYANDSILTKIYKTCSFNSENKHFLSFNKNFKNIYAVSDLCYQFLCCNPKLKIAYAGMKAFTECDLSKDVFRPKNEWLNTAGICCEIVLSLSDFKKLISEQTVSTDLLETKASGLFHASIEGLSHKVCGFSGGNKIFLYLDDVHRKAYKQLLE